MVIHFKYKSIRHPDGHSVKTPSIPITFIGPSEALSVVAVVDSGADFSVLPKEVAEVLGLRLDQNIEPCYGISGKIDAAEDHVRVKIQNSHESYSFNITVKILLSEEVDIPVLIGRSGFFEEFEITFNESREKISLKKVHNRE